MLALLATHWWHGAVEVAVGVTAVLTAIGLISRLKPVRWIWHQLVAEPLSMWVVYTVNEIVTANLEPIRHELEKNDGSSIKDAVDRMEKRQCRMEERLNSLDPPVTLE